MLNETDCVDVHIKIPKYLHTLLLTVVTERKKSEFFTNVLYEILINKTGEKTVFELQLELNDLSSEIAEKTAKSVAIRKALELKKNEAENLYKCNFCKEIYDFKSHLTFNDKKMYYVCNKIECKVDYAKEMKENELL